MTKPKAINRKKLVAFVLPIIAKGVDPMANEKLEKLKHEQDVLRQEVKQKEQQKTNVKAFIQTVKKYTDMQELDAALLREFIDRIEISHAEKHAKTREITIVYNFIGAFDFTRAIEEAQNTTEQQQKTA